VKKLICWSFRDFIFDPKCLPTPHRSPIRHPRAFFLTSSSLQILKSIFSHLPVRSSRPVIRPQIFCKRRERPRVSGRISHERQTRRLQITSVRFPGIHFLVVLRGECGIFNQIIAAHGDPS
jgi:hypothetical protein